jgi:hypothetical protein
VKTSRERDGSLLRVDLEVTHDVIVIGGDDDVSVLNDTLVVLVLLLRVELEFQKGAIKLVDGHDRDDSLGKSLTEHSLSLDRHTFDTVDDDKATISDTKGSSDLRREINVTRGVNQVKEEITALRVAILGEGLDLVFLEAEMQRDTSRLDGNGTVLLVLTGIHDTTVTGILRLDDTSGSDEGISQRRLSVINMSNNGHVTDVLGLAHNLADVTDSKVHHFLR